VRAHAAVSLLGAGELLPVPWTRR